MKKLLFLSALLGAILFTGCKEESGEALQERQQAEQTKIAIQSTGMPAITSFTEKKSLKMILELRDSPKLHTYTYMRDMNGNLNLLCDSVGFPIPYSTQYTNPMRQDGDTHSTAMPMADPNGLYSPASSEGSYVMCINPKDNSVTPTYIEERLITSTYSLKN